MGSKKREKRHEITGEMSGNWRAQEIESRVGMRTTSYVEKLLIRWCLTNQDNTSAWFFLRRLYVVNHHELKLNEIIKFILYAQSQSQWRKFEFYAIVHSHLLCHLYWAHSHKLKKKERQKEKIESPLRSMRQFNIKKRITIKLTRVFVTKRLKCDFKLNSKYVFINERRIHILKVGTDDLK